MNPTSSGVMYIAVDNCLQRGYCLGDVIGQIKVAELFVLNEPHERTLMSLLVNDPLNFLWDGFIERHKVEVLWDDWEDRGNRSVQYKNFETRLDTKEVHGIHFDTYKELYPRIDGGFRQKILCGIENGLGRKNIFEYYYFGQQHSVDKPKASEYFEPGLIPVPEHKRENSRSVFLAPLEKCQLNRHFTWGFWGDVIDRLLKQEIEVTLNDNTWLGNQFVGRPHFQRTFLPFGELITQIAEATMVACGNTGIGWVAGSTNTPLFALEKQMVLAEYSFEKCGVQSMVRLTDSTDATIVARLIQEELEKITGEGT